MKILVLNYEYPPLGGGAGQATGELLKALAKHSDHSFHLVTASPGPYSKTVLAPNCTVHALDIGKNGRNLHHQSVVDLLKYTYACLRYCRRFLQNEGFDVCHAHFAVPCGWIAGRLRLPYIVTLRGSDVPFHNPRFRVLDLLFIQWITRSVLSRAAHVVALSDVLAQEAAPFARRRSIRSIPNGVDCTVFSPREGGAPPEPPLLLYVGRLARVKGVDLAIRAFRTVLRSHSAARLRIIGDGPERDALERLAKELGVAASVEFAGAALHSTLPDQYRETTVFLLPSVSEGMSNVCLEAMASGLPVVCTPTSAAELIHGNGAVSVDHTPQAFAEAIERVLDDRSGEVAMRGRSRELALQYTWSSIAEQYLPLYNSAPGSAESAKG